MQNCKGNTTFDRIDSMDCISTKMKESVKVPVYESDKNIFAITCLSTTPSQVQEEKPTTTIRGKLLAFPTNFGSMGPIDLRMEKSHQNETASGESRDKIKQSVQITNNLTVLQTEAITNNGQLKFGIKTILKEDTSSRTTDSNALSEEESNANLLSQKIARFTRSMLPIKPSRERTLGRKCTTPPPNPANIRSRGTVSNNSDEILASPKQRPYFYHEKHLSTKHHGNPNGHYEPYPLRPIYARANSDGARCHSEVKTQPLKMMRRRSESPQRRSLASESSFPQNSPSRFEKDMPYTTLVIREALKEAEAERNFGRAPEKYQLSFARLCPQRTTSPSIEKHRLCSGPSSRAESDKTNLPVRGTFIPQKVCETTFDESSSFSIKSNNMFNKNQSSLRNFPVFGGEVPSSRRSHHPAINKFEIPPHFSPVTAHQKTVTRSCFPPFGSASPLIFPSTSLSTNLQSWQNLAASYNRALRHLPYNPYVCVAAMQPLLESWVSPSLQLPKDNPQWGSSPPNCGLQARSPNTSFPLTERIEVSRKRRKWSRAVFTPLQRRGLEKAFQIHRYVAKPERKRMAESLGLSDAQVKIWFQNRRMKWRQEQRNKNYQHDAEDLSPSSGNSNSGGTLQD